MHKMTKNTETESIVLGVNNLKTRPNGVISVNFSPKKLATTTSTNLGLQIHSSYLSWESSTSETSKYPKNFQPTPTSLATDSESDLDEAATLKPPNLKMTKPSFSKFYSELLNLKQYDPNLTTSSISFGYFSK